MNYTIYQTTNNINGRLYIGMHQTDNIDDEYLGSGKLIKQAIEKYGVKNFTKEILHVFDSAKEMKAKETEIVDEDFIARPDTYNLRTGGEGGSVIGRIATEESKQKQREKMKGRYLGMTYEEMYDPKTALQKRIDCSVTQKGQLSPLKGTTYEDIYGSEEAEKQRLKRSEAHQGKTSHLKGQTNWALKDKPQEKIKCPTCKTAGGISIMKRWHLDNCKYIKKGIS